ncbi:MAG: DUF2490 domain-containing protein [Saprospiraceae bacterium]|nr:DUF2490 domain-containing protein [Saprospiraceae bacterium]
MKKILALLIVSNFLFINQIKAQFDEDQLGAWYMYFFSTQFGDSNFGVQGDVQFRNWDLGSDLEQLLLRGGFTYKPENADIKFTLGYGNITTGAFGDDNSTVSESRIYQEALFPTNFADRVFLTHRFRYEQRFVEGQDLRTRYRYNLFMNIPLNQQDLKKGAIYLALYNELFINGQREIGSGKTVEVFDRNRFYAALGYTIKDGLRTQLGVMKQTTNAWSKNQLQLSLHHSF